MCMWLCHYSANLKTLIKSLQRPVEAVSGQTRFTGGLGNEACTLACMHWIERRASNELYDVTFRRFVTQLIYFVSHYLECVYCLLSAV